MAAAVLVVDALAPLTFLPPEEDPRTFEDGDLEQMDEEVLAILAAVWAEQDDPSLKRGWTPCPSGTSRE